MFISQQFEELQGWNSEFKLITSKSITRTYFENMAVTMFLSEVNIYALLRAIGLKYRIETNYPQQYHWTYFDTKLSMPSSATEEGA